MALAAAPRRLAVFDEPDAEVACEQNTGDIIISARGRLHQVEISLRISTYYDVHIGTMHADVHVDTSSRHISDTARTVYSS